MLFLHHVTENLSWSSMLLLIRYFPAETINHRKSAFGRRREKKMHHWGQKEVINNKKVERNKHKTQAGPLRVMLCCGLWSVLCVWTDRAPSSHVRGLCRRWQQLRGGQTARCCPADEHDASGGAAAGGRCRKKKSSRKIYFCICRVIYYKPVVFNRHKLPSGSY